MTGRAPIDEHERSMTWLGALAAAHTSVPLSIALPADVLEQIDRYAAEHGFSRSGFIHHAVKKAMAAKEQAT
jgi:hypothetical protein